MRERISDQQKSEAISGYKKVLEHYEIEPDVSGVVVAKVSEELNGDNPWPAFHEITGYYKDYEKTFSGNGQGVGSEENSLSPALQSLYAKRRENWESMRREKKEGSTRKAERRKKNESAGL